MLLLFEYINECNGPHHLNILKNTYLFLRTDGHLQYGDAALLMDLFICFVESQGAQLFSPKHRILKIERDL